MCNIVSKKLCWTMIFILFLTWSGLCSCPAFAREAPAPNAKDFKQAADRLGRLFDALEEALDEIPRDTFEPEAIVNKVGWEPEKLFEWVRDNTYLVPYRGSLRGPIGVLMDRLGNSLDRALLLHELLTVAGHKARLVQGTLPEERAEKVLNEARPIPPGGAFPTEETSRESMEELIARYAKKYGLDPAELKRIAQSLPIKQQRMAEEVAQRVEEQTKAILELVGEPKIDIRAAERAKALEALQDHWWVQWKNESGWVDLDPTLPERKVGKALAEDEATYQPDELNEDLLHLVTIRLVIERWEDGELEEEKVLEHTLRPSELFGKRIGLRHIPVNWPKDLDLLAKENPIERLKATVLEEKEWLPVLGVGSEQIRKFSFTDAGRINEKPGKEPASMGGGSIRRGFSLFGPAKEEPQKETHLTAEWIEYEIRVTGEPARTIRRQVFDLIGPAARQSQNAKKIEITKGQRLERGLALLGENEILVQVCHLSAEFFTHLITKNLLANREILPELLRWVSSTKGKGLIEKASKITPLPGPEYSLALARHGWSRKLDDIYLNCPNIISYFRTIQQSSAGEIVAYHGLDIVDNRVAVLPQLKAKPFQIRLKQGVVDTNTEALVIKTDGELAENTGDVFAWTIAQGIEWVTIRDAGDSVWQKAELSKDVYARIEEDLAKGYVVLVPKKKVLMEDRAFGGWWRLNPSTGHVLGMGQDGTGQGLVTYSMLLEHTLLGLGGFIGCPLCQDRCRLQ